MLLINAMLTCQQCYHFQLLDRSQQRLELVLIPESQFVRRSRIASTPVPHHFAELCLLCCGYCSSQTIHHKVFLINIATVARYLDYQPVQKWGTGLTQLQRRLSRFLPSWSPSSPQTQPWSPWSLSPSSSETPPPPPWSPWLWTSSPWRRWWPANSLNGGSASTTSFTSFPTTTQHRWDFHNMNPFQISL